jgi:hypothetical protein
LLEQMKHGGWERFGTVYLENRGCVQNTKNSEKNISGSGLDWRIRVIWVLGRIWKCIKLALLTDIRNDGSEPLRSTTNI